MQLKESLLSVLHDLRVYLDQCEEAGELVQPAPEGFSKYEGICCFVWSALGFQDTELDAILDRLAAQWTDSSGDYNYPVPSPELGMAAVDAFWNFYGAERWLKRHPYGRLRRQYLDWMIETLSEELGLMETSHEA